MPKQQFVGNRLRQLRNKASLSLQELSDAVGIPKATLVRYENQHRQPSITNLAKLAKYFGVTSDYLLGQSDNPESGEDSHEIVPTEDEWLLIQLFRDGGFSELRQMLIDQAKKRSGE